MRADAERGRVGGEAYARAGGRLREVPDGLAHAVTVALREADELRARLLPPRQAIDDETVIGELDPLHDQRAAAVAAQVTSGGFVCTSAGSSPPDACNLHTGERKGEPDAGAE